MDDFKSLLKESYIAAHKASGKSLNPTNPEDFRKMIKDETVFQAYKNGLSEGLEGSERESFEVLAENSRMHLVENSYTQFNPYETLTLPILRKFYPKLIAKELVNVMPIDKPDVIKGFMKAKFGRHTDLTEGTNPPQYPYEFPYVPPSERISDSENYPTNEISRGNSVGINIEAGFTAGETNLFSYAGYSDTSLDRTNAHIEKDFRIVGAADSTGNYVTINSMAIPDVDGNVSVDVTFPNGTTDKVLAHVDFNGGVFYWETVGGATVQLYITYFVSLEENKLNSYVNFSIEKIRLTAIQRQISAYWTLPMEQDLKALYDMNLQTELVNIIGEQIAIEIDREIIDDLIRGVLASDTDGLRTSAFNRMPPPDYAWGPKMWYENIVPVLTHLSAEVYNANLMDSANTVACNPTDAAVLENLNSFAYDGGSVAGGSVGYRSGTVQGGKWKILVSSIVPKGHMLLKYRSEDMQRASYLYAPYVPAVLSPFPIGANPSLTVMTRYAKRLIRPESLALLQIQNVDWNADAVGTGNVWPPNVTP